MIHDIPLQLLKYYAFPMVEKLSLSSLSGSKFEPQNIYVANPQKYNFYPKQVEYDGMSTVIEFIRNNKEVVSERIFKYENGNGEKINCVGGTFTIPLNIQGIKVVSIFIRQTPNLTRFYWLTFINK